MAQVILNAGPNCEDFKLEIDGINIGSCGVSRATIDCRPMHNSLTVSFDFRGHDVKLDDAKIIIDNIEMPPDVVAAFMDYVRRITD